MKPSHFLFGFVAAFAFLLVSVVDPYSGATASPYFQVVGDRYEGAATQTLRATGTYTNTVARDGYTVEEIVKPEPIPEPVAVTATKRFTAPAAAVPDPGTAKAYAYDAVAARGWGEDQYSCLVSLWQKESGWRVNAMNSSSGAYGIPQSLPGSKMGSAGADWETNAGTQIEWGLGYIVARYGSPCGAWAKSQASGWY
ncbi:hypothetical protein H4V99_002219 [Cryobacterium sp. CG_9.6]|nr:hypothetical protein [Cryobacterium sp. CG_9.6]